jgi:hypothetical protein
MSKHRAFNIFLVAVMAAILSASYLLDGPSDLDAMRAVQASKQDAIKTAATHAQRTGATRQKDHQVILAKAAP